MTVSRTDLANIALTKIGKNRLTDIDADTTEEAIVCRLLFDEIRDEVLAQGKWLFALKRVALAQLSTAPAYEFSYGFQLPADFLKLISVNETVPGTIEFQIESDELLTDESSMSIRYIKQESNTAKWSPGFKKAFTLKLAAEMSYAFKADKRLTLGLYQLYQDALENALANETSQATIDFLVANEFTKVR